MSSEKKYMINIDSAGSKLHLNPMFFGEMWCRLNEKKRPSDGGKKEVTKEEAEEYLIGKKPLNFYGKLYTNLTPCENCSKRQKQSKDWDIDL